MTPPPTDVAEIMALPIHRRQTGPGDADGYLDAFATRDVKDGDRYIRVRHMVTRGKGKTVYALEHHTRKGWVRVPQ